MAGKLRKKVGPIETECEETSAGNWVFNTGAYDWQYAEGRLGLNLMYRKVGLNIWEALIYAKNLPHAVMFAQGFEAGITAASTSVRNQ